MTASATAPAEPAVALVSGGLDSAVMLDRALAQGRQVYPLYVRQGALWEEAELSALTRLLETFSPRPDRLAPLSISRIDLPSHYPHSWVVDRTVPVPDENSPDEAVFMPGRNLALLLQGALLAQSRGLHAVLIGLLRGNPFPDSRPPFLRSFEQTFAAATDHQLRVETPMDAQDKAELIREARHLPLEYTFTCLRPVGLLHCGHCNKCAERRRGFARAGVPDPTPYAA